MADVVANRGRPGGAAQAAGQRGWIQKRIARAFVGYGPVLTTAQLAEHVLPRLQRVEKCSDWYRIRRACERVAVRVGPRRRPLRWRLKPDLDRG
jgi:hypothetical protein